MAISAWPINRAIEPIRERMTEPAGINGPIDMLVDTIGYRMAEAPGIDGSIDVPIDAIGKSSSTCVKRII